MLILKQIDIKNLFGRSRNNDEDEDTNYLCRKGDDIFVSVLHHYCPPYVDDVAHKVVIFLNELDEIYEIIKDN